MDWQILLGILIGIVGSIVGNLLTPFVRPLWGWLRIKQEQGYHSQLRQKIKVLQTQLDFHNRMTKGSSKDLFLYLFQWLLGILALLILAATCLFLATALADITDVTRKNLRLASLVCLIASAVTSGILISQSRDFTDSGMQKRSEALEAKIAELMEKLPLQS